MKSLSFKLGLTLMIALVSVASAGVVNVGDIALTMPNTMFYQGGIQGGTFAVNTQMPVFGSLRTADSLGYDYQIINAVVNTTPSSRLQDTSSNGMASGDFAGGVTLTITGQLMEISTGNVYAAMPLLAADIVPNGPVWTMQETANTGELDISAIFRAFGGLGAGIAVGNGDVLVIGEFRADFSFGFLSENPINLSGSAPLTSNLATLQITAIPEPATLALLGIGGLLFRKIRK